MLLVAAGAHKSAQAQEATLSLVPIGTWRTGIFDGSAAEAVAFDAASARAFITNVATSSLDILDLSDPSAPELLRSLEITPWGETPRSVDVHGGLVAVAIEASKKTDPGLVLFLDVDGNELATVQVGALPDMLSFTPDGSKVVVANEGEPNDEYTNDPEGSVSIINLANGAAALTQDDVVQADFAAFNDMALDPSIRIYGPGATVAQDLEPESVAISPDSSTAWVTLQENNALARVDLEAGRVSALLPLGYKDHSRPFVLGMQNYQIDDLPIVGETAAGQAIRLGGFSGLWFDGIDPQSGELLFLTHTDRGPNTVALDVNDDGVEERPFALPDFQPRVVGLALDATTGVLSIQGEILLTRADETPLSGLPNLPGEEGAANADEPAVDLSGNALPPDPLGADLEGIVRAPDGTGFWMVDEYRPALYYFDEDGRLIERFIPKGLNKKDGPIVAGVEALPEVLGQRRTNRGFEAAALEGDILYAFLQSPLDNPDRGNDANGKRSTLVRIIAFDTVNLRTVGQYLYRLDGGEVDKIGDALALGDGEFLVLERDDVLGAEGRKFIYRISLNGATNLEDHKDEIPIGPNEGLELQSDAGLAAAGIRPVRKQLFVDLTAAGYDFADKPEGMMLIDEKTIAVINDDDFAMPGSFDPTTGTLAANPGAVPSVLSVISLKSTALDVSDRDEEIHLAYQPLLGMFQPDGIAAYTAQGATWLVSANEGEARDFQGYSEQARVADLVLDLEDFPDAGALIRNQALGRLHTTTAGTDTDGDGLADRLLIPGARSFSIWDADGRLIWDSGDDFERLLAELLPEHFNADSDSESGDSRSDDKGPEPEGVAVGQVGDASFVFIALERIGGVMVYDVSDPYAPVFVSYHTTRDFAGEAETGTAGDLAPEGLRFISANESPSGEPLLLVANEMSGTLTVFALRSP